MHSFLNLNINQNESLYGKKTPDLTEQNQNNDSMKKNHNAYSFYGKPQIKKNSPYIKAHYQIEESPEIENEINNDQKKNHNPLNFIGKPSIKKNSAYIKSLIHTEDEDIFDVESKKNIKEMDDESFNLEKNHNKKKNEEKKKIESNFTNKDKKTVSTPERERKYQNSIINTKPKNESTKKSNLVNSALPILFEPQNNKINQEINKEKKNEAEVNKQKQGNQNEDSNFTNERQNNSANEEKKKPVYHTKPLLKIEKQMLVHKALVVSDKFPHYVHPERASKKFKKN